MMISRVVAAMAHWVAAAHPPAIRNVANAAVAKARARERAVARSERQQWHAALGATDACHSEFRPSRLAFQWIKGRGGWTRSPVGQPADNAAAEGSDGEDADPLVRADAGPGDGDDVDDAVAYAPEVPLNDQAAVDLEGRRWSGQWMPDAPYVEPAYGDAPLDQLAPLTAECILMAAMSFPFGTGLGADQFGPRAVARLSEQSRLSLALVLMACERIGSWERDSSC